MGLDRIVNQIYGIDDIRLLYENDIQVFTSIQFNGIDVILNQICLYLES
jgi:hypothetical protein